jgi:hypothetical protein
MLHTDKPGRWRLLIDAMLKTISVWDSMSRHDGARLLRHRVLDGCRCYVRTKAHCLSILVLYSDTAVLCRYCFFSYIPIVGHQMSKLVAAFVYVRAVYRKLTVRIGVRAAGTFLGIWGNGYLRNADFETFNNFKNKYDLWRIVYSGMLRRVALVRTDVSEERSDSFIRVTRIGELGITLAITSNRRTLRRNVFLHSVRMLLVTASVVPSSPILPPWWRSRYVPPKRQFLQEPHGVTSQKTPFFKSVRVEVMNIFSFYMFLSKQENQQHESYRNNEDVLSRKTHLGSTSCSRNFQVYLL